MNDFLSRVRVHWHAVVASFVAAAPVLLQQLQVIDLRPLLSQYLGDDWAALLIALLPFYIAFLKPMLHIEDKETDE